MSIYASYQFRFEFDVPANFQANLQQIIPVVVFTKLAVFHFFDLYRGMWRYTSINDLLNIIKASVSSSLILISGILLLTRFQGFSRSVFLIDIGFTILEREST